MKTLRERATEKKVRDLMEYPQIQDVVEAMPFSPEVRIKMRALLEVILMNTYREGWNDGSLLVLDVVKETGKSSRVSKS